MTDQEPKLNPEEKTIKVDIDDETAQGVYANLAISNFSKEEFVLDFVFIQPQVTKGKIRSRVVMSPRNAKRLAQMLMRNVDEYEKKMGSMGDNNQFPGINLSVN
jgi:hypothetical protein